MLLGIGGVLGVCAVATAVVIGARGVGGGSRAPASAQAVPMIASAADTPGPTKQYRTGETPIEVPNVTGKAYAEAELVLRTAGFQICSRGATTAVDGRPSVVVSQSPAPGVRLAQGDQVTLSTAAAGSPQTRSCVVVIDPGHQAKADLTPEPVGPGSPESKEKATAGATGVATKRRECRVALDVSLSLKRKLEAAGVKVIMTRVSDDTNLSNIQRAQMANEAGADLFVRVHADAASKPSIRGVSVMFPDGNPWVAPFAQASKRAASAVDAALVAATGAGNLGTSGRGDLSGFNWSKVPAILVEAGMLSNPEEDRLLATPGYQDKVATGIAGGILKYLGK